MSEKVDNQGKEDPLGEVVTGGELVWDEYHCNPRAEVVLVSNDMVGFRVEAWYIKKKRSVTFWQGQERLSTDKQ
jgi:hypothetical protein